MSIIGGSSETSIPIFQHFRKVVKEPMELSKKSSLYTTTVNRPVYYIK